MPAQKGDHMRTLRLFSAALTVAAIFSGCSTFSHAQSSPIPRQGAEQQRQCALPQFYRSFKDDYTGRLETPELLKNAVLDGRRKEQIKILVEYDEQRNVETEAAVRTFVGSNRNPSWHEISYRGVAYEELSWRVGRRDTAKMYFEWGTANVVAIMQDGQIHCYSRKSASYGQADYRAYDGPCRIKKDVGPASPAGTPSLTVSSSEQLTGDTRGMVVTLRHPGTVDTAGADGAADSIIYGTTYFLKGGTVYRRGEPLLNIALSSFGGIPRSLVKLSASIDGKPLGEMARNGKLNAKLPCSTCGKVRIDFHLPNEVITQSTARELGDIAGAFAEGERILRGIVFDRRKTQCMGAEASGYVLR